MSVSLEELGTWLDPLLQTLTPGARARLAREIALDLRRSNIQRIKANVQPDGSAMEPRKRQEGGSIRRGAMFRKLALSRYFKLKANATLASVGFAGRVALIAGEHDMGGPHPVRPGGPIADYPVRRTLGFSAADLGRIQDQMVAHLSEGLGG